MKKASTKKLLQLEKWVAGQNKQTIEREFIKKVTKRLTEDEQKNGKPVLQLRCIETYSDAPTNKEYFTKDYVYHVIGIGKQFVIMQTNFPDLTANIPNNVIHLIFAGFGKENSKDLKVVK